MVRSHLFQSCKFVKLRIPFQLQTASCCARSNVVQEIVGERRTNTDSASCTTDVGKSAIQVYDSLSTMERRSCSAEASSRRGLAFADPPQSILPRRRYELIVDPQSEPTKSSSRVSRTPRARPPRNTKAAELNFISPHAIPSRAYNPPSYRDNNEC